ncbi:uncharacterized protein LOC132306462 [Cornus florida]|uniref:uncharacterized protein LOC132306462 n=1 Tax=Cornus florida TaxID=4283 RepID=UPI0028A18AD3|nr:uncharacterized protein LOC132306462 [Cornus florida]
MYVLLAQFRILAQFCQYISVNHIAVNMMSTDTSQSISLKVLVEKDKNRVVFVESDKDFVDVIFSFMAMPIGNIVKLACEHSLEENFGCLNNLYRSVENLDEVHLESVKCKDMLLRSRSAAEIYYRNLKLKFVDTNDIYVCCVKHITSTITIDGCTFTSTSGPHYTCMGPYYNARCGCGFTMNTLHKLDNQPFTPQRGSSVPQGGVFVKPTAKFMIFDEFK